MKFKKLLVLGGLALVSYSIGRVMGHLECLNNIVDEHSDCLFKDTDSYTDKMGKFATIVVTKPEKETDARNA